MVDRSSSCAIAFLYLTSTRDFDVGFEQVLLLICFFFEFKMFYIKYCLKTLTTFTIDIFLIEFLVTEFAAGLKSELFKINIFDSVLLSLSWTLVKTEFIFQSWI